MSRLTRKIKDGYCLVENDACCELYAINTLGKLEDLMGKYNIDSIKKLEEIIKKGLSISMFSKTKWQKGEKNE